jgi:hypothetical protein
LPDAETLLKKLPNHGPAWQLWIGLINASGRDVLKESDKLLEDINPLPWTLFDWPPYVLRDALFMRAIIDNNWNHIIKYGDERWDWVLSAALLSEQKYSKDKNNMRQRIPIMNENLWRRLLSPLIEAHLASNNLKKAEDIMDYWKDCGGWSGAFNLAAIIAEKHKYSELAKMWSR